MSSLAKHVIHRPKPIRSALIVFFAITITALSFWLYHQNYNERAILKINDLSQKNKLLTTNKQALINENGQLLEQVQQQATQIESHQHFVAIQKVTDEQLQLQLSKLQSEIVILNKDLMFYQNVTQGTGDSKLQIRELHLRQDNTQADRINYRLVITQGQRIKSAIKGTVIVTLNKNDKHTTINEHSLNLRSVQVIEGQIELTDSITPDTISIALKRKKKTTLTQTFDWQLDNN